MNLKNKALALAIASAVAAPNAFAVQGSDGMHYTSASEGFYASIRAKFVSGAESDDNGGFVNDSGTRFGIQGTGEMSHGLEGFYRYETGILNNNGDTDATTRLSYVGIRGGFGSLGFGTLWGDPYNWVGATTDLPNAGGGNFTFGGFRKNGTIQYNSPDFNGLKVGVDLSLDGGKDTAAPEMPTVGSDAPDSELDEWSLSAQYAFGGFTVAGTYINTPEQAYTSSMTDATGTQAKLEDGTAWAVAGTYGQDNWGLAAWYGQNNNSDFSTVGDHDNDAMTAEANAANAEDTTAFSVAGHVAVGHTKIVVMHETRESSEGPNVYDDTVTVFDVQYSLNSKAKVWVGYVAQDFESDADKDDYVNFGIRHDF